MWRYFKQKMQDPEYNQHIQQLHVLQTKEQENIDLYGIYIFTFSVQGYRLSQQLSSVCAGHNPQTC